MKGLPFIFSVTLSGQGQAKLSWTASINYHIFKDFADQEIFQRMLLIVG